MGGQTIQSHMLKALRVFGRELRVLGLKLCIFGLELRILAMRPLQNAYKYRV